MRKATVIELDDAQREKLLTLAHSNTAEVRLARRAGIVLLAADELDNETISEMLNVGRVQVGRWRSRYGAGGFAAIEKDLPRGGRKPKIDPARDRATDHADQTGGGDTVEHAHARCGGRGERHHDPAHLEQAGLEAAPGQAIQGIARPQVC